MPSLEEGALSNTDVSQQIQRLKDQNRNMTLLATVSVCAALLSLAFSLGVIPQSTRHVAAADNGILHVRGLVVEDDHGVERVRLGAPLPDPMGADGIRHKRKGPVSGLIISDTKGTERGGYVTDDQYDEAFFTLDSRKGQEVLFLANPDGGTNLDLFDRAGNEAQLTVFPQGPRLVLKKNKQIVAQLPPAD